MLIRSINPQDGTKIFGTPTQGDFIRYNATSGHFEVVAEPLALKQIVLTPQAAPLLEIEGALFYHSTEKVVKIAVES